MQIKIKQCNNILNADINISEGCLNIFYGRNGIGKSTVAKALQLFSMNESLNILKPFGAQENEIPTVEGFENKKILVFGEKYVDNFLFKKDSIIDNSFNVFVKTAEYEKLKNNIDNILAKIKTNIIDDENVMKFKDLLEQLDNKFKLNGDGTLDKRKMKGIEKGMGSYTDIPKELKEMTPFFSDNKIVINWVDWRTKGYKEYGQKGICPFCAHKDGKRTASINKSFEAHYDKSSVETVHSLISILDNFGEYINAEKVQKIKENLGKDFGAIELSIRKLISEDNYIFGKFKLICDFNDYNIEKDTIQIVENKLKDFIIDVSLVDHYFNTETCVKCFNTINEKTNIILNEINTLKAVVGKFNKYLKQEISKKTSDINDFLNMAGYKYNFKLENRGDENYIATLHLNNANNSNIEVKEPKEHLSWGEKNAFALIMFLFDALSKNVDLIILDDPISSFDTNKKYAIMNRLFKTKTNDSFYNKTCILLTHDFEPIIDYVKTHSGRQDPNKCCAYYVNNNDGNVEFKKIDDTKDILPITLLLQDMAKDNNICLLARLGCLRKYFEYQFSNPNQDSNEYNIISSLMHGRVEPSFDKEGNEKLKKNQIEEGTNSIKNYISEFDYTIILTKYNAKQIINEYKKSTNSYEKIMILRYYIEIVSRRDKLREFNDVLRKFVDESFHIENDYIYSLDIRKYDIIPKQVVEEADEFMKKELTTKNN